MEVVSTADVESSIIVKQAGNTAGDGIAIEVKGSNYFCD